MDITHNKLSATLLLAMLSPVTNMAYAIETNQLIVDALEEPGFGIDESNVRVTRLAAAVTTTADDSSSSSNTAELALARMKIETEVTSETTELLGDKIDLNSGAISLTNTDLTIPGNFPIDVGVTRVYRGTQYSQGQLLQFADWQLDIPSISTTIVNGDANVDTWTNGKPCSGSLNPGSSYLGDGAGYVVAKQYWSGDFINVPSSGSERLLEPDVVTSGVSRVAKNWRITCQANGNSEAFIATSPQGITYTFSMLRTFPSGRVPVDFLDRETNSTWTSYATTYNAYMQVTEIKDRFNNKVTYHYSSPDQLDSITSSDGRSISFTYELGVERKRVKSVTSNGKTWNYYYRTATEKKRVGTREIYPDQLYKVQLPDGREWVYEIDFSPTSNLKIRFPQYTYGNNQQEDLQCTFSVSDSNYEPKSYISKITHPNGVVGVFEVRPTLFGRSKVPKEFEKAPNDRMNHYERCFSNFAIIKKTLSGKGVETQNWYYSYSQNPGQYVDGSGDLGPVPTSLSGLPVLPSNMSAMDLRSTTVVAPDGSRTIHVFDRRYTYSQDKEIAKYVYDVDGTTLLQHSEISYSQGNKIGKSQLFSANYNGRTLGATLPFDNESQHNFFVNDTRNVIYQYIDNSSIDIFTTEKSNFNIYGAPRLIHEYNNFSSSNKYTKVGYYQDTNNWLINQEESRAISSDGSNYFTTNNTTYYPYNSDQKSLINQEYRNGRLLSSNTYFSDGNIKQISFGINNRWIAFGSYKRGISQQMKLPQRDTPNCSNPESCFISASMVVDDNGNITKITDFNGNPTNYEYDTNNRVVRIKSDDNRWTETSISYDISSSDNSALEQNIAHGNYKKTVTLDGLMRPILVKEWDIRDEASTVKYKKQSFNTYGRPIFTSFLNNSPDEVKGVINQFDGLNRQISSTRTSDNSQTTTKYLSKNKTSVTDGNGNMTVTSYLAYGTPSNDKPTEINAPDTDTISLSYNILGQVTAITQSNVTESRYYNAFSDLCKIVRPETGISAYAYNSVGEMIWHAEGTVGSTVACDESSVPLNHRVMVSYNNVGEIKGEDFPDLTPDRQYSYDNNGNLKLLTTGSSLWTYSYNSLNLPEKETLSLDGRIFSLTWGYDGLGAIKSLEYPSGSVIDFAPNALGQATKAGSFATRVSYYPNGQLKQFIYGNGIVRSVSLDSSTRIDSLTDIRTSALKTSLTMRYDLNDNLSQLIDGIDSSYSINNLVYDGANRLKSANGKWGNDRYSYDGLGNMLSRTRNSSITNYHYNTLNRLNNLSGAYAYSYQYDAAGNIINNGRYSLVFNRAQQMISAKSSSYEYDGYNRKIKQTKSDGVVYSLYNKDGQLFYRESNDGIRTDSIYLGKQIVAEIDSCPPSGCAAVTQPANKSCQSGYALNSTGTLCEKLETQSASVSSYNYSCPSGYTLSNSSCLRAESRAASSSTQLSCPQGGALNTSTSMCSLFYTETTRTRPSGAGISCSGGEPMGGGMRLWECTRTYAAVSRTVYACDSGWTLNGTTCSRTLSQAATRSAVYACPSGWGLNGTSCSRTVTSPVIYSCPAEWTLNGSICVQ